MVLPHRIELWTSPLPRECSTTELRQREKTGGRRTGPAERRGKCHTGVPGARIAGVPGRRNLPPAAALAPGTSHCCRAKTGAMTQGKASERERRSERLAEALKQNLRRRKTQARGRAAEEAPEPAPADPRLAPDEPRER